MGAVKEEWSLLKRYWEFAGATSLHGIKHTSNSSYNVLRRWTRKVLWFCIACGQLSSPTLFPWSLFCGYQFFCSHIQKNCGFSGQNLCTLVFFWVSSVELKFWENSGLYVWCFDRCIANKSSCGPLHFVWIVAFWKQFFLFWIWNETFPFVAQVTSDEMSVWLAGLFGCCVSSVWWLCSCISSSPRRASTFPSPKAPESLFVRTIPWVSVAFS